MPGAGDEDLRDTLARLQRKMALFDAERSLAWESLRALDGSGREGVEVWPSTVAVAGSGLRF